MAEKADSSDDDLENFRRRWQSEIVSQSRQGIINSVSEEFKALEIESHHLKDETEEHNQLELQNNEEKATLMYLQGVKCEQSGEMVTAIRFYKRAMKLVPDIEKRVYTAEKKKEENAAVSKKKNLVKDSRYDENMNNEGKKVDLLRKFQKVVQQDGRICIPMEDPKGTHMSSLPREVVVYLLKWVISSDLDLRSLEQVALVCRGLYVCSRDAELWKLVCLKIWNGECENPNTFAFLNWRDMYILRPRIHFNGCYINKVSYVRPGENSFQDSNYQPWHLVNYFRYLRFYADRSVLMLTSAEEPSAIISQLRRKSGKFPALLHGHYSLQDNRVNAIFKRRAPVPTANPHFIRRRRRDEINNNENAITEQIFHLELEIRSVKKRLHCTLHWIRYSVQTMYQRGEPSTALFDINPNRFPPLWYSRVRSYNTESERPLSLTKN